ncbi:hypothetical protein C9374_012333 [Naegleria lovaniensis]|uniref:Uncharacterized protein n=1 Tax=Naegleria lovaniensis TaxID=51637 RepID=A0AA88G7B9_NAELO|nr:uncharacterized protein C9374_012333 [Naegleria lovaniensis]KAG2373230.1 hypothetical protein C9374_012333 [Naegleria lovaniensis]
MFQGHYGPAGVIHYFFPDVSLVWLMISTQLIDIVYFSLQVLCKTLCQMNVQECSYPFICHEYATFNVERMRKNAVFPSDIHSEYTHSLTGSLALALIFTILYRMFQHSTTTTRTNQNHRSFWSLFCILFLGVVSHWVLDVLVHRPDVTIFPPFTTAMIGLGTWENWSKWGNTWLEWFFVWLGMIGILAARARANKLDRTFWLAFVVYGISATGLNWFAYFGDDTSERADQVVDGAAMSPDLVPLISVLYVFAFSVSYYLGSNNMKSETKKVD